MSASARLVQDPADPTTRATGTVSGWLGDALARRRHAAGRSAPAEPASRPAEPAPARRPAPAARQPQRPGRAAGTGRMPGADRRRAGEPAARAATARHGPPPRPAGTPQSARMQPPPGGAALPPGWPTGYPAPPGDARDRYARAAPRPHGYALGGLGPRLVARLIDIVAVLAAQRGGQRLVRLPVLEEFAPICAGRARRSTVGESTEAHAPAAMRDACLCDHADRGHRCSGSPYEVPAMANRGQTLGKRLHAASRCVPAGGRPSRSASAGRSGGGTRWACRRCSGTAAGSASCCSSSTPLRRCSTSRCARPCTTRRRDGGRPGRRRTGRTPTRPSHQPSSRETPYREDDMTRLTRADLDALPTYVPGRNPPTWPASWACRGDQAGQQRGAVRPAAGRGRRRSPRRRPARTATRTWAWSRCATRWPRGTASTPTGSPPAAARWRSPSTWSGPPACPATRSSTRGGRSRRTRSSRRPRARPACGCPTPPGTATTWRRWPTAVTDRTRLVLVCNPNNPTGTAVRRAELDRFLDAVPADVLVVLDEAYREFVTDPDVPDGLTTYGDRPNVVVLRTLSKAWGLAGLRIGYLVAPAGGGRRGAQGGHAVLHQRGRPGRRAGRAGARRTRCSAASRWSSPSATGSPRRCASCCPDVPTARPTSSGCRWATRCRSARPARAAA